MSDVIEEQMLEAHQVLDGEIKWGNTWLYERLQRLRDQDDFHHEFFGKFYPNEPKPEPPLKSTSVRDTRQPRLIGITRRKRI